MCSNNSTRRKATNNINKKVIDKSWNLIEKYKRLYKYNKHYTSYSSYSIKEYFSSSSKIITQQFILKIPETKKKQYKLLSICEKLLQTENFINMNNDLLFDVFFFLNSVIGNFLSLFFSILYKDFVAHTNIVFNIFFYYY